VLIAPDIEADVAKAKIFNVRSDPDVLDGTTERQTMGPTRNDLRRILLSCAP
jgi:hypothetical protein